MSQDTLLSGFKWWPTNSKQKVCPHNTHPVTRRVAKPCKRRINTQTFYHYLKRKIFWMLLLVWNITCTVIFSLNTLIWKRLLASIFYFTMSNSESRYCSFNTLPSFNHRPSPGMGGFTAIPTIFPKQKSTSFFRVSIGVSTSFIVSFLLLMNYGSMVLKARGHPLFFSLKYGNLNGRRKAFFIILFSIQIEVSKIRHNLAFVLIELVQNSALHTSP